MGCSNSKTSPEEDSGMQDIETTRGCTDIIWIPIFAVFWIGMVAIAIIGFNMGKPNKLIYAVSFYINHNKNTTHNKKQAILAVISSYLYIIAIVRILIQVNPLSFKKQKTDR